VFNNFYAVGGTLKNENPDHEVTEPLEPWREFLDYMLNLGNVAKAAKLDPWRIGLPHTLTISFAENEQNVDEGYAKLVCDNFNSLGIMGVSIIVASGDYTPNTTCETNKNPTKPWLVPKFPSGCPWVTSVGATHIQRGEEIGAVFSAGGFSDYFPRPSYQGNGEIDAYLRSQSDDLRPLYNSGGRAYPDVSAVGTNIGIYNRGKPDKFCGASASAPVFASAIALLNAKRLEENKKPLGFLNPWLYREGKRMLRDITRGDAVGCRFHPHNPRLRNMTTWKATRGWDAVTGLGVPQYDKMVQRMP
jgi:tripeptidyl-peptidase I